MQFTCIYIFLFSLFPYHKKTMQFYMTNSGSASMKLFVLKSIINKLIYMITFSSLFSFSYIK